MVFESLVVDVLNRLLGDYVVNLDKSQLSLGIWKGNGVAAVPVSREMAAWLLVASVRDRPGATTCSCPPRPQLPASPFKLCKAGRRFSGGQRGFSLPSRCGQTLVTSGLCRARRPSLSVSPPGAVTKAPPSPRRVTRRPTRERPGAVREDSLRPFPTALGRVF
ncbi:hypothetical protein NN561_004208 [Cricetulus griseus]